MRSKTNTIKDIQKIAGTKESQNAIYGVQEAILLKLDKSKKNSDGWYIKISASGKESWAFNSFDWGEGTIPKAPTFDNIVIFTEKVKVLVIQEVDQEKWRIIKGLDDCDDIEVGEKVIRMGESEIRITEERIDINAPEVYINGERIL